MGENTNCKTSHTMKNSISKELCYVLFQHTKYGNFGWILQIWINKKRFNLFSPYNISLLGSYRDCEQHWNMVVNFRAARLRRNFLCEWKLKECTAKFALLASFSELVYNTFVSRRQKSRMTHWHKGSKGTSVQVPISNVLLHAPASPMCLCLIVFPDVCTICMEA